MKKKYFDRNPSVKIYFKRNQLEANQREKELQGQKKISYDFS